MVGKGDCGFGFKVFTAEIAGREESSAGKEGSVCCLVTVLCYVYLVSGPQWGLHGGGKGERGERGEGELISAPSLQSDLDSSAKT
jgi:hypothetical protein